MAKILVVGLNPAWQKTLILKQFTPGSVNRGTELMTSAAGKGLNAASILRQFGHEVSLLQCVGGGQGQQILAACERLGIHSMTILTPNETRCCTTLIDTSDNRETEVIEPYHTGLSDAAFWASVDRLNLSYNEKWDAVVFCGQAPEGVPEDAYPILLDRIRCEVSVVDAYKGIPESFFARVGFIKINGIEFDTLRGAYPGLEHSLKQPAGPGILLTNGGYDAEARLWDSKDQKRKYRYHLNTAKPIVNPIGAGDAVTGGFVHYLVSGMEAKKAFAHALSIGTASCMETLSGRFSEEFAERIFRGIVVE